MKIEPLSYETLDEAIELANMVFPNQGNEPAELCFKGSLNKEEHADFLNKIEVQDLRYWVAKKQKKVIGISGIYEYWKDMGEASWVGWFCVDPEQRGEGIGTSLLNTVLEEAKKTGKEYLRVYTSTEPNQKTANKMYDKLSFVIFKREDVNWSDYTILYRQLKLK